MANTLTACDLEVFLSRERIERRVAEMGAEISRDFAGQDVLLAGVLKGAAVFLADLARSITINCTYDFVAVSSYGVMPCSNGAVRLIKDLDHPIENRNVILVEDILDSGVTLRYLENLLLTKGPAALKIAVLLDKPARRLQPIQPDYVGFAIPNRFVVGYGMDFAERYRNLPDICWMPEDVKE